MDLCVIERVEFAGGAFFIDVSGNRVNLKFFLIFEWLYALEFLSWGVWGRLLLRLLVFRIFLRDSLYVCIGQLDELLVVWQDPLSYFLSIQYPIALACLNL